MRIPQDLIARYKEFDPEAHLFIQHFDEPENMKVFEVGSHDLPLASMLASMGHTVYGVDLRACDQFPNYHHIVGDFCALPNEFWKEHRNTFDCVIAVSAIEHFGLATYGEGHLFPLYDVIAMRYIWDLLKEGGRAYVSVPFGGKYNELPTHWRVYDWSTLKDRIGQDFSVDYIACGVVEEFEKAGVSHKAGEIIDWSVILNLTVGEPYVSALLKLRKVSVMRKDRGWKRETKLTAPRHKQVDEATKGS